MDSAPEVPKKRGKKLPKIAKFADTAEPALPTGKSTIEIVTDTETRDLKTAAEDANKELESLSGGMKIDVVTNDPERALEASELEIGDLDEPDTVISDELTEVDSVEELAPVIATKPEAVVATSQELDEDGIPDDPLTVSAIDDIVAKEADTVLEAEDEDREAVELAKESKKPHGLLRRLFSHASVRWGLFITILLALFAIGFTPDSRYYLLNTAGVRSTMSLKVVDSGTQLPLKNVAVSAGGAVAQTDAEGIATLTNVLQGKTKLVIEKRAFSKLEKHIVIGLGSNPLGDFQVRAVGAQYTLVIKDYLSGKPIEGAEASSGDGNALSDKDGKIVLTLDTANQEDEAQVEIRVASGNYRDELVGVSVSNREVQAVEMVPARKHVFVSKRSGTYDIYSVDIDGKNEQKIVAGTGLERDDIALIPQQNESVAALIATRERVVNPSGFLLSTLYLVDTSTGQLTKVDQSEKIQAIGWSKSGRLVYVKIATGADGTDPKRHRIISLNTKNPADIKELASANAFNDIHMAGDRIYYAPSIGFAEESAQGVLSIGADGQEQQNVLADTEAFVLKRSSYETLDISNNSVWYSLAIGSGNQALPSQGPPESPSKLFTDNLQNNFSLWVDEQAGKGVLQAYDRTARKDTTLASVKGLKNPVYWLNDRVAVYRLKDSRSTADYAVSVDGGEVRKISDVADSLGLDHLINN